MSNSSQPQMGFINYKRVFTPEQIEKCEKSFYGVLRRFVIPQIDDSIFEPVNKKKEKGRDPIEASVKVAALIVKCAYNLSYEELDNKLEFDLMAKYGFDYEYEDKKPVSGRTLRRFLLDCQNYQEETGEELINQCFENLAGPIAKAIEADPNLIRIDSTFIESSIKHLSRLEIIFESTRRAVKALEKNGIGLPENLKVYLQDSLGNRLFYHKKSDLDKGETAGRLLKDAWAVCALFPESLKGLKERQTLKRVLDEQSARDEDGNPVLKDKKGVRSDSVQSPVDPEATFRSKNGKTSKGYLGTDAEISNGEESVIVKSRTDRNIRSDSDIVKEMIPELKGEEPKEIVADGAYGSKENIELAEENNISLEPTNLPGKPTDPIHAKITLNEEKTEVALCPAGNSPKTSSRYGNDQIGFSMDKDVCDNCPLKNECCVKANPKAKNPRTCRGLTSVTSINKAKVENCLSEEEKEDRVKKAHFRNGIESTFSDLKRNCGLSGIGSQFRGLIRTGLTHTIAAMTHNCRSLFNYFKRTGWESALSPEMV